MTFNEQPIRYIAILVSVLLHALLFVKFSDVVMGGKSQAPKFDTKISLNFLPTPKKPVQEVVKKIAPPKPILKEKPARKIVKQKKVVQPLVQEQAAASTVAKDIQRKVAKDSNVIKRTYLSKILTIIEGNKYYPRSARRRGVEGNIHVSFMLKDDGYINGLDTSGGPLLLSRAAKTAVKKSLPLPTTPTEIKYPMHISYAMQFKLN
ncbi:MAG: energy transducer TonB [Gammaproteobacteria bacterium]|nr:energy transducer TonB [Gammaproteobacteria bacterium]